MKDLACFPFRWKYVALALLVASVALSVANNNYGFEFSWFSTRVVSKGSIGAVVENQNLTDELWTTGLIGSLMLLSFCRERIEDEYVRALRLRCWQWAIAVNYVLFLIADWLVFGLDFLGVILYNVITPLVIYLLIFYSRMFLLPKLFRKKVVQ
ncbi:MAG: hypothetical protein JST27_08095 [Bacteroidetes bacterium]|nr:hypothetical protein [Bacteroidota bacterium]